MKSAADRLLSYNRGRNIDDTLKIAKGLVFAKVMSINKL